MRRNVTELLDKWSRGDAEALGDLMPLVYGELRRIARAHMAREAGGHTLQPTALTNEAFLRLCGQNRVRWQNRAHFYALASEMMRRILVDHARGRLAAKRGANAAKVSLADDAAVTRPVDVDVLALHEALRRLAALDERQARVVELRYFGGLTTLDVAEVLAVSESTVKRDWETARRWLHRELRP